MSALPPPTPRAPGSPSRAARSPLPRRVPCRGRSLGLGCPGLQGADYPAHLGERPLMHPPLVLGLLARPLAPGCLLHPRVAPRLLVPEFLPAHLRHQPSQPRPLAAAARLLHQVVL